MNGDEGSEFHVNIEVGITILFDDMTLALRIRQIVIFRIRSHISQLKGTRHATLHGLDDAIARNSDS